MVGPGTIFRQQELRVLEAPIGSMYLGAILLHNFRSCVYPNTISQYFPCQPRTLEDYGDYSLRAPKGPRQAGSGVEPQRGGTGGNVLRIAFDGLDYFFHHRGL